MSTKTTISRTMTCLLTLLFFQCAQSGSPVGDIPEDTGSDTSEREDTTKEANTWISLEFALESDTAPAGTPVSYSAILHADNGSTKTVDVAIESDKEPGIGFDDHSIVGTLAEVHTLTATANEQNNSFLATATLTVVPGEPNAIELKLQTVPAEVDTELLVLALIKDSYGNICDDSWTLSATAEPGSDLGSVQIDGEKVTFRKDGWFTLIGTVDTNGLEGTLGPLLVDSYGPKVDITSPERGAWSTDQEGAVVGTVKDDFSDITEITVNGAPQTLGSANEFSENITYEFGLNPVETLATDSDGNVTSDRRSVLFGDFKPSGSGIDDGIQARINEDTISVIEQAGKKLIEEANLKDFIPSPVWEKKAETWGIIWYRLTLYIKDVSLGEVKLDLNPLSNGSIDVTATIYDIRAPWNATGVAAGVHFTGSGTISADSITLKMKLRATIEGGKVKTSVSDVLVSSTGFRFDWNGNMKDVIEFFGVDLDGIVRGFVEDAIRDTITKEVPKVLSDALEDLSLKLNFDLLGGTYNIEAKPHSVQVDDAGLTLGLQTFISPQQWKGPRTGKGSLYFGYHSPTYANSPGMILGFSADFINQALYAFWGGGLLQQTIAVEDFEIPLEIPNLPSDMGTLQIVVDALLPPVVVPSSGDHLLNLQAGDVKIDLYNNDPTDPGMRFATIYVGLDAGLNITISDQNKLAPEFGDISIWFDIAEPQLPNGLEISLETLAISLVDQIMPLLYDAIGSLPVPVLYGLTMSSIEMNKDGPEKGYVTVAGDLVIN